MEKLLLFVANAAEFADIHIRKGEKATLNDLNKGSRFRQKGKVQSVQVRNALSFVSLRLEVRRHETEITVLRLLLVLLACNYRQKSFSFSKQPSPPATLMIGRCQVRNTT
jgi:hypothetical protein